MKNADARDEVEEESRDEEEWARVIENLATAAEAVAAPESPDPVAEQEPVPKDPLPDLNESLQKIPENSRELIDELFRGHFVGMKTIDRSKLY